MNNKELREKVVSLTLEANEDKRNSIIDELSSPEAREMLKMVFHTLRSE